jgi:GNAT superfamily N-acetyltransferase
VTDTAPSAPILGRPGQAYDAARLRWAAYDDAARLTALWQRAYPDAPETESAMCPWLEHGGALMLEDHAGALLAALRWRETSQGWEVDRVATRPSQRGQGYGRWLMTKVEAAAIRANVPYLTLSLPADAPASQLAYYARMGYVPTETPADEATSSEEDAAADAARRIELRKRVGGTWQTKTPGANGWQGASA